MITDFHELTPVRVLDAIEDLGYSCNGQLIELNSYENRVFQIGIEDEEPLVVKFYRPHRWTDEQILEEHEFTEQLAEGEVTVVPAMSSFKKSSANGHTLHHFEGYRYTLYKRYGGRSPDVDDLDCLEVLGRYIGRIHLIGSQKQFSFRPTFSITEYGYETCSFLQKENFLPLELESSYKSITELLLQQMETVLEGSDRFPLIRVHGDCHMGNVLWRDDIPHFVDFDDARNGFPIQDLWMLLSGDRDRKTIQLQKILKGYQQFFSFDPGQIRLIETLRTLRMMYFSAWIARRWGDPAFPRAFPWFNTERYWSEHILELKEQASRLQEPSIELYL